MRFMLVIKDTHDYGHGIPTVVEATSIDDAIATFVQQDAGAVLREGYFIDVTQAGRPRQRYLYSGRGKPTWMPEF